MQQKIVSNKFIALIFLLSWLNLKEAKAQQKMGTLYTISATILYDGIDNILYNNTCADSFHSEECIINNKYNEGQISIRPINKLKSLWVYAYKNQSKIDSFHFKVEQVPDPIVSIISKNASVTYSPDTLFSRILGLRAENPFFVYQVNYEIRNFRVTFIFLNSCTSISLNNEGYYFSNDVKKEFLKLEKGDIVIIDNIAIIYPDKKSNTSSQIITFFR